MPQALGDSVYPLKKEAVAAFLCSTSAPRLLEGMQPLSHTQMHPDNLEARLRGKDAGSGAQPEPAPGLLGTFLAQQQEDSGGRVRRIVCDCPRACQHGRWQRQHSERIRGVTASVGKALRVFKETLRWEVWGEYGFSPANYKVYSYSIEEVGTESQVAPHLTDELRTWVERFQWGYPSDGDKRTRITFCQAFFDPPRRAGIRRPAEEPPTPRNQPTQKRRTTPQQTPSLPGMPPASPGTPMSTSTGHPSTPPQGPLPMAEPATAEKDLGSSEAPEASVPSPSQGHSGLFTECDAGAVLFPEISDILSDLDLAFGEQAVCQGPPGDPQLLEEVLQGQGWALAGAEHTPWPWEGEQGRPANGSWCDFLLEDTTLEDPLAANDVLQESPFLGHTSLERTGGEPCAVPSELGPVMDGHSAIETEDMQDRVGTAGTEGQGVEVVGFCASSEEEDPSASLLRKSHTWILGSGTLTGRDKGRVCIEESMRRRNWTVASSTSGIKHHSPMCNQSDADQCVECGSRIQESVAAWGPGCALDKTAEELEGSMSKWTRREGCTS